MAVKPLKINIKYPTPTAAERLHQRQQELRKKSGLPEPEEYKKRIAQKQKEIDAMKNEEVEQLDEMPESAMKTKDVHAHLKKQGWSLARTSGGHDIYKHPKSVKHIAVPRHGQLKAPLIKGILKTSKVNENVELDEQLYKKARFVSGPAKKPFKSNTVVPAVQEARISGLTSRRRYPEKTGVMSGEGDTSENIPHTPKTEKQKRIKAALDAIGDKMKAQNPKLREAKMENDPCWKGYEMIGKKKKNGREVPNCVPIKESEIDPSEREMQGKTLSRKAQIVKDAAKKGKKMANPDKFQDKPELSSEITKAP